MTELVVPTVEVLSSTPIDGSSEDERVVESTALDDVPLVVSVAILSEDDTVSYGIDESRVLNLSVGVTVGAGVTLKDSETVDRVDLSGATGEIASSVELLAELLSRLERLEETSTEDETAVEERDGFDVLTKRLDVVAGAEDSTTDPSVLLVLDLTTELEIGDTDATVDDNVNDGEEDWIVDVTKDSVDEVSEAD